MRILVPYFPKGHWEYKIVYDQGRLILSFSPQEGEADCWPLACPSLSCEYTAIFEGECCPRCVSDPCLADNIVYDIQKTCLDSSGVSRLSGAVWTMAGSPCTSCKCKVTSCLGYTSHTWFPSKISELRFQGVHIVTGRQTCRQIIAAIQATHGFLLNSDPMGCMFSQ